MAQPGSSLTRGATEIRLPNPTGMREAPPTRLSAKLLDRVGTYTQALEQSVISMIEDERSPERVPVIR